MNRLRDSSDVCLIYEPNYKDINLAIDFYKAKLVLIEAAEINPHDMEYCLKLCKQIRRKTPECKLLLMCSEQDETSVEQVVDAKRKKQIDDFVFYDVTIDYLASKLISM